MISKDTFSRFLLGYEKKEDIWSYWKNNSNSFPFFLGRLRGLRWNHCEWEVRKTLARRIQTHSRIWLKQPNLSADELTVWKLCKYFRWQNCLTVMCDNHFKGKPSVSNLTVGNKVDVPKCIGKKITINNWRANNLEKPTFVKSTFQRKYTIFNVNSS